jgi:type II secretory ATPase GspE/PulE/Tfp pilus assembly ATPase PilB-like protein
VVFGFFKKKKAVEEEEAELEPVSFLGPVSGDEVNLQAHSRLVDAGLMRSKDLITEALARRADTIRIEPKGPQAQVSILIDGVPFPVGKLAKPEALAITQMLKLLAGLDVKERKAPQSGGIKAEFDSKPYLLSVNSVPVADGERLLIRVTDQKQKLELPADLGMGEDLRVKLRDLCGSNGVVIVCGPTGSGTTTTLFALVRNVDAYIFNIFTLGDLGGRKLNHVTAFDVNPDDDLATTLGRAIRVEANVLLCDPIEEADTAKALFSRAEDIMLMTEMSAKDISSALMQLIAWTGNPQLVASGLAGMVTQKLIRLLCPDCRQTYRPKAEFLKKLGLPEDLPVLYRKPTIATADLNAETCRKCGGVGYFGRTAMFELLEVTPGMKELINGDINPASIRAQMRRDKMTTLQHDGLRLVAEGKTSLEELQRVFKTPG